MKNTNRAGFYLLSRHVTMEMSVQLSFSFSLSRSLYLSICLYRSVSPLASISLLFPSILSLSLSLCFLPVLCLSFHILYRSLSAFPSDVSPVFPLYLPLYLSPLSLPSISPLYLSPLSLPSMSLLLFLRTSVFLLSVSFPLFFSSVSFPASLHLVSTYCLIPFVCPLPLFFRLSLLVLPSISPPLSPSICILYEMATIAIITTFATIATIN
jgi:hypothetical protein